MTPMTLVYSSQLNEYTPRKQNQTKNSNIESIILELQKPKTFTELEKTLSMSHTTLSKWLNELQKKEEIEKTIKDGKTVYQLTKTGIDSLEDFINISKDYQGIKNRNGKHFRDYSSLWGSMITSRLHWGLESDLILDKNLIKNNILSKEDVEDIEILLFEKLSKNIKKKDLDENIFGEMVLGFKIEYPELVASIKENALLYFNNMSKEERKLLEKIDPTPWKVTNKEWKRWEELRKKTYEKIKKEKNKK